MTASLDDMSTELVCDGCGYDLRAHPADGLCPECGASVAESRRLGAVPRRPAWRDSDPRWRRRLLLGVWILVLYPFAHALQGSDWAANTNAPTVFKIQGSYPLNETFLYGTQDYQPLLFCIAVVLLFARERGRRRGRFDFTRRWGVLCSYVTLLLSAAPILFICSLVMVGIAALLQSIPLKYQPGLTRPFVEVSVAFLRYGPQPKYLSDVVLVAFSAITMLFACAPLYDAIRSGGRNRVAAWIVAPLGVFAVGQIALAGWYGTHAFGNTNEIWNYAWYFRPDLLSISLFADPDAMNFSGRFFIPFWVETLKWVVLFTIATGLSFAQIASWFRGGKLDQTK